MSILSLLLVPMYYIAVPEDFSTDPEHRLENVARAFQQMAENPSIVLALAGTIVR